MLNTSENNLTMNQTIIPLRDYQALAVNDILENYDKGFKRIICQQITGAGKSLIIAGVMASFLEKNKKILCIAHKVELLTQLANHATKWLGVQPSIIADKKRFKRDFSTSIQVASIQALRFVNREELPNYDLIIIDEAHHAHSRTYADIFQYYNESLFLGVTATPMRLDGRGLNKLYGDVDGFELLLPGVSYQELLERGYLVNYTIKTADSLAKAREKKLKITAGEYNLRAVEEFARETIIYGEIVKTWKKYGENRQTVLYPASVELSKQYCLEFNQAGIPAAHLDANTPSRLREERLEKFRKGEYQILCQYAIVIEGVDVPNIGCVQIARPTNSWVVWLQALGRGLRPAPGKKDLIVIDHTDNHLYLPWPQTEINWSLEPVPLPTGTKFGYTCDNCQHIYSLTKKEQETLLTICPRCSSQHSLQPKGDRQKEEPEYKEVVVINSGFGKAENLYEQIKIEADKTAYLRFKASEDKIFSDIYQLHNHLNLLGHKKGALYFRVMENVREKKYQQNLTKNHFEYIGLLSDYKPGWAFYKFKEYEENLSKVNGQ